MHNLKHWVDLYRQYRNQAVSLDIETTRMDGPISVLGLYRLFGNQGMYTSMVRGENLTVPGIITQLQYTKLIITFNGSRFDLPKIQTELPNALPSQIPYLDLYLLAKELGIGTKLKILERTFGIKRTGNEFPKDGTHQLWKRYMQGEKSALDLLAKYNEADVRNLFSLADCLIQWAEWKLAAEYQKIKDAIDASSPCIPMNS